MLGNGVCTYIVLPTTSGPPSCPRSTPVEKVQATFRFFTLPVLISLTVLYRVDAGFLFCIVHSLSPAAAGDGGVVADAADAVSGDGAFELHAIPPITRTATIDRAQSLFM